MSAGPTLGRRHPAGAPWVLLALLGALLCVLAAVGVRTAIGALTLGLQLFFLAFFVRHLAFVVIAIRAGAGDQQAPGPDPDPGAAAPGLSVLVACHNEERVLDRLLAALGALRYPAARLQFIPAAEALGCCHD